MLGSPAAPLAAEPAPGGRVTLSLDPDWRFLRADPGPAAAGPDEDDRAWARVSAPHTYNDVDTFDHRTTPDMAGETAQWSGRTWYRKRFVIPASDRGRQAYVEFEGVRQVADVWINGHFLGSARTGFVPFGFDLTPWLRSDGGPNLLAVRCDNRFLVDPPGETLLSKMEERFNAAIPSDPARLEADLIPWNNPRWHPAHGGIYRNVYLHLLDPVHIPLPLYDFLQTAGPYVYADRISPDGADVHLDVPVENGRAHAVRIDLSAAIVDDSGRAVLTLADERTAPAGGAAAFALEGRLPEPRLWDPDHPHLYLARLTVRADGAIADTLTVPFGIRSARWTADAGLFFNGRALKLHGWGQRPTDEWPGLGAAQPDWLHAYTLALTKQAGSNFQRWGHCAAAPGMIAAGDELGLITDQPGVDGESDTVGAAWTLRAEAFRDVLIYFRNHPSILIWEAGNQKVTADHARELRALFEHYDPHGGRVLAYRRADPVDVPYMDVGIGTEGGREIPSLPVVEGEYDRDESPRRLWDRYSPSDFGLPPGATPAAPPLDSETFAVCQVSQFVEKLGAAGHSGGANWIFSDTTSGARTDTETARDSGEVDGVRLPKEAYYVCAVLYGSRPAVHLIGHWNYSPSTRKTVYAVSNGDDVELFLNGSSLGHGLRSDRYLFAFPSIAWAPGEVKAVATRDGRPWAEDAKRTAGPAVALRLTPLTAPGGWRADGSDVALVDVEAIDARGERCPTFQGRVDFLCSGPAVWRGGWNSERPGSINQTQLILDAGINRIALRSSLTPGSVVLEARSAGLASRSLTLHTLPIPLSGGASPLLPAKTLAPTGSPP